MTLRLRLALPAIAVLLLSGCSIELHRDLMEQDANDIWVLLSENGISVSKEFQEGGNEPRFRIYVPKADAATAVKLLKEHSLPRPNPAGFDAIREGKGMIPTELEQRAMFLESLGGEVSRSLNKIDGVLEARTIVMLPEKNDLAQPDKKPQPSASVFLKYRMSLDGKPPVDENVVRRFVASAVEELKPENVAVIMSAAQGAGELMAPDQHLQTVLGFRMARSSVGTFKASVFGVGLVMVLMAALTTWTFLRGGSSTATARPRRPGA